MEIKYKPEPKILPRTKLMGRIKLGNFFSLPEKEFVEYIKKIEKTELFKELLEKYKIVRYRKFSGIKQPPPASTFKEEITSGESFDPLELIQKYPEKWEIVKKVALKVGEEKFSLFLAGKIPLDKILEECSLSHPESEEFREFINAFQLQESFFSLDSQSENIPKRGLFKIARIHREGKRLFIVPAEESDYLVKGRYVINYERWRRFLEERKIPPEKVKKMSSFFRKLNIINQRTTTIYRILLSIKNTQKEFFLSGNPQHIKPLYQRDVAKALRVNPSTISRTIAGKSLICPWGEEKSLKEFFLRKKEEIKNILLKVIKSEEDKIKKGALADPLSDDEIKQEIEKNFGIKIARRTVTKYRKELKIPSSRKRKKLYKDL